MKVRLHVMTTSIRRREGVTVSDVPRGKYLGNLAGTRPKDEAEHFIGCPTCGGWIDWRASGKRLVSATSRRGEPIGWEQRGFRTLKCLFVINNSEGVPKMKTTAIAATLALGLGLSGAHAQNANDRPGMTAPRK